jgi:hypothetical protein
MLAVEVRPCLGHNVFGLLTGLRCPLSQPIARHDPCAHDCSRDGSKLAADARYRKESHPQKGDPGAGNLKHVLKQTGHCGTSFDALRRRDYDIMEGNHREGK